MPFKYLVIPIEIQRRELSAACNLTLEAINRGYSVFLGQKQQIFPFIQNLPKSTWFLKSIVPGELQLLKKIKKYKHKITSLDVEGLILSTAKNSMLQRFSRKTIKLADGIFFWGEKNYQIFRKVFGKKYNKKLHITGAPIVEDWLNANKVNKCPNNKNILIIPSFGYANSQLKKLNFDYALDNMGFKKIESIKSNCGKRILKNLEEDYQAQILAQKNFIDMLKILSKKLSNYNITIRPHPNENREIWKQLIQYDNIKIDSKTNSNVQIMNNSTIIHFNSTMSVQSALLKKKNIIYFGISKKYKHLINDICLKNSYLATSIKQLIHYIKLRKVKKINLKKYIAQTKICDPKASFLIMNAIEQLKNSEEVNQFKIKKFFFGIYSKFLFYKYEFINNKIVPFLSLFSFIPFFEKYHHGGIYRKYKTSRKKMILRKWKFINVNKIKEYLDKSALHSPINKKYRIRQHFSGIFFISPIG